MSLQTTMKKYKQQHCVLFVTPETNSYTCAIIPGSAPKLNPTLSVLKYKGSSSVWFDWAVHASRTELRFDTCSVEFDGWDPNCK